MRNLFERTGVKGNGMPEPEIILEFDRALSAPLPGQTAMEELTLQLCAGEMLLVRVEPGHEQLPLADAALGLAPPARGRVIFMGTDWQAAAPDNVLRHRARIGRVFDRSGWISNLDVIENITLAQRHHTRRPIAEIEAEARALARQFGLEEVPRGRPAAVPHRDLRRAEWARAWMGRPSLVCLERPGRGVATEYISQLADAVRQLCARGGAAIWIADDDREIQALGAGKGIQHRTMRGAVLTEDNT